MPARKCAPQIAITKEFDLDLDREGHAFKSLP
jgi:hypothetical protein